MGTHLQEQQIQRNIHDLKKEVEKLRHDLTVQNHLSRMLIGAIVAGMNKMSPNQNVYEVFSSVIEALEAQVGGKTKAMDEAISEALKMLKKT